MKLQHQKHSGNRKAPFDMCKIVLSSLIITFHIHFQVFISILCCALCTSLYELPGTDKNSMKKWYDYLVFFQKISTISCISELWFFALVQHTYTLLHHKVTSKALKLTLTKWHGRRELCISHFILRKNLQFRVLRNHGIIPRKRWRH